MATVDERLAALEAKVGGPDDAVTSVRNNETAWSNKAGKGAPVTLVLSKDAWDETQKTQTLNSPLLVASTAYAIEGLAGF